MKFGVYYYCQTFVITKCAFSVFYIKIYMFSYHFSVFSINYKTYYINVLYIGGSTACYLGYTYFVLVLYMLLVMLSHRLPHIKKIRYIQIICSHIPYCIT